MRSDSSLQQSRADRFGQLLRRLREGQGLSLRQLADDVYYSYSLIGKVELGKRKPSRRLIERCDATLEAKGELIAGWERAFAVHQSPKAVAAGVRRRSRSVAGMRARRGNALAQSSR